MFGKTKEALSKIEELDKRLSDLANRVRENHDQVASLIEYKESLEIEKRKLLSDIDVLIKWKQHIEFGLMKLNNPFDQVTMAPFAMATECPNCGSDRHYNIGSGACADD